jgi:lipid A 3-O-deacylase
VKTCTLAFVVVFVALVIAVAEVPLAADEQTDRGVRARSLSGGWGTAWKYGVPGYGKTSSDVEFVAFQPALGWFVLDRLELFGEATLLVYYEPTADITGGLAGIGGRYHFRGAGRVLPFVSGGAGFVWTSLDVVEIDRVFNGQLFYGAGIRLRGERNQGAIIELRNHHMSNAGTKGANLGLNAFAVVVGVEWLLRPKRGP